MAVATGYSKIATSGSVFLFDTGDTVNSYKGEPITNIWGIENGSSVNNRSGWDMPYAYNGSITNTVYSGTWNGNRIWEVLHTLGTSGYGGYESWRLCVNQPTASPNTYNSTRRVAIKVCVLEGSITDMALHTGGGNSSHNSSDWTPIPPSQVPSDCPQKSGWYQFLADASWGSTTVGHCVGLGFITYNRVKILTTEPMYYPSSYLIPFTGYTRSTTQAMIDIVGGNTINLVNMSYGANNAISFDGTDDYTEVSSFNVDQNNEFTLEAVIYPNTVSTNQSIIKKNTSNDNWPIFSMALVGSNLNGYYSSPIYGQCLEGADGTSGIITANKFYYVAYSKGAGGYTTMKLYINGVSVPYTNFLYGSHINAIATSTKPIHIGRNLDGPNWIQPFNGRIPIAKVYNRQLTDSEILSNFNHYKTRFSIT